MIKYCNLHDGQLRRYLFCLSVLPLLTLCYRYFYGSLGINPLELLISNSGEWALYFLLASLAITPLRRWLTWISRQLKLSYGKRLSDWNFLIKSRRMIGLFSFFYACIHFYIYGYFDQGWEWGFIVEDMIEKPYLTLGALGLILLIPLVLTSPKVAQKAMGRYWRKLHRSVYIIGVLCIAHYWLQVKIGEDFPALTIFILLVLYGHRLTVYGFRHLRRQEDDGMESYRPKK